MLATRLAPYSERVYSTLRIGAGAMWAFQGMQEILGILGDRTRPTFLSAGWILGVIALVCGSLIAVGWKTVPAAFVASVTMVVAYAHFNWGFALNRRFFPGVNGGELTLLYALVFLSIACRGSGRWSVDGRARA